MHNPSGKAADKQTFSNWHLLKNTQNNNKLVVKSMYSINCKSYLNSKFRHSTFSDALCVSNCIISKNELQSY